MLNRINRHVLYDSNGPNDYLNPSMSDSWDFSSFYVPRERK